MPAARSKTLLKVAAGIAITGLALWLSFRRLEWQDVRTSFGSANYSWVVAATTLTLLTLYGLGWRWQILLKPKEKFSLADLFRLNIIGQYVNILMPWRVGEVARAYLASKQSQASAAFVMGTVAVEKILDFLVFVVFWLVAPVFLTAGQSAGGHKTALVFFVLGAGILVLFAFRPQSFLRHLARLARLLPHKVGRPALEFISEGLEAFGQLKSPKVLLAFGAITLGLLFGQILTNLLLFRAFGIGLSLWPALLVLMAVQAGNIPPSVPGKIGIFEYAVILALSAFRLPREQALSYAIMLHAVAYIPKILLGALFIGGIAPKRMAVK
ncbi:MAG: lysylphosphatidylglycerol synthase transmembrane domain-containing protein [Clostridiales bacterium]|nr:lysylphosphatidylglycerol synthase transmembrane domain-containing protein [Clostridiales bacterium]